MGADLGGLGVFDGLANFQRGLGTIPQGIVREGGIPQRVAFPAPVTDLASNDKILLVKLNDLEHGAKAVWVAELLRQLINCPPL